MNVSLFCILFVDLPAAASALHDVFQAAKVFHVSNTVLAVRCKVTIHCKCHSFPDYLHGIDLFVSQLFCNLIMTVRIFLLLYIWIMIQPRAIKNEPKCDDAKRQVPPFFKKAKCERCEGIEWADERDYSDVRAVTVYIRQN